MTPRILALGGGGFLMEESPSPIDRFVVSLTGNPNPRICFVSTASGDPVEMIDKFYAAYQPLGCEATHLAFFRKPYRASLPLVGLSDALLDHDAIFVGGGNTKSALGVWREWGLERILAAAWRKGILLAGVSAGAICWFQEGLTDSYWGGGLRPLPCLGLLPDGCCVHFSSEPARRVSLHAGLAAGDLRPTVAIDDGAAVLFAGRDVQTVVGWRPGAKAYKVTNEGGRVTEKVYDLQTID